MSREGSYPAPPYWPERLTGGHLQVPFDLIMAVAETSDVRHSYIADGYPGPCVTIWSDKAFLDWLPALTVERAEQKAAKI